MPVRNPGPQFLLLVLTLLPLAGCRNDAPAAARGANTDPAPVPGAGPTDPQQTPLKPAIDANFSLPASFGGRGPVENRPLPPVVVPLHEGREVAPPEERGVAVVDPATGRVGWRALTCRNPHCTGQGTQGRAFLFICKVPGMEVGADGQLARLPDRQLEDYLREHLRCPACGGQESVTRYDPPEVVTRRDYLLAELKASREAYRQAKLSGSPRPNDHRTPTVIMQDLTALPAMYLMEEP